MLGDTDRYKVSVSKIKLMKGYIGIPVPRIVDGKEKVTGNAKYLLDIEFPGMLDVVILRSSEPHALITKLNYENLTRRECIKAVISGKDSKLGNIGPLKDHPPLKYPKVRSLLDEILAVAACDEDKALSYIEQDVEISYQKIDSVFDPIEALKPNAPLVHEELGSNKVNLNFNIYSGNVDEALRKSYLVVEDVFEVPRVAFAPMGTLGAIARVDEKGNLILTTNTQAPYQLKRELAESLRLNPNNVKIEQPYIGGAFGRGMDIYPFEVIASYLALKIKRPVKILYNRYEDFKYSPTRQPAKIKIRTGVTKDGKILARDVKVTLDTGAYVSWGAFDARVMGATTSGLYIVPNVRFVADVVYTNNPYTINMRGAGNPQITFAIEVHMDRIAEELGIDPVEFRLNNAYEGDYVTPQNMYIQNSKLKSMIKLVSEKIGWKGRHSIPPSNDKYYGIGFASVFHVGGGARVYKTDGCGILIKIDDFGKVTVYTGMSEMGQGSINAIAQIVATELGINIENVEVVYKDDADNRPWDVGTHASRSTFICGNAALRAAKKLKEEILNEASKILGVPQESLIIENGIIKSKDVSISLDKLVRRIHFKNNGKTLISYEYYDPPTEMLNHENKGNISAAYVNGVMGVLVEVDKNTYKIKVDKIVAAYDVGTVINPLAAKGQIIGGIVQGLGHALFEELILDNGDVINPWFLDYEVPVMMDIPDDIDIIFIDNPSSEGPYGAKGVGEMGIIPIAAAIANAVYDAIGYRPKKIPILPSDIYNFMGDKNE